MKYFIYCFVVALAIVAVQCQSASEAITDPSTSITPTEPPANASSPAIASTTQETSSAPTQSTVSIKSTETTSTESTVTTAAPAPKPSKPDVGTYTVNDTDGNMCVKLVVGMKFQLNLTDGTTKEWNFPNDTKAHGNCGKGSNSTDQVLTLKDDKAGEITWTFTKSGSDWKVSLLQFEVDLPKMFGIDASQQVSVSQNKTIIHATMGFSYSCGVQQKVTLHEESSNTTVTMEYYKLRVQAFFKSDEKEFGASQSCPDDSKINNIVPIAVGAALAALVVIVLIAYLISRNRNKSGYESV